jgi:cytochrome P450
LADAPGLTDLAFWARPASERAPYFADLRRRAPVSWQQFPEGSPVSTPRGGFWAVTRHADVQHVSRTPQQFCSGRGVGLGEVAPEILELNASFLVMDAPRHTKIRKIVSNAFTPRRVAELDDAISAQATNIVDEFVERGSGDVVEHLSVKLPLWTISRMMGVPESMRSEFVDAAESQVAAQDPEFSGDGRDSMTVMLEATQTLHRLAAELIAARRSHPTDDIFSALVHAKVDGEKLSDQMLGGIFVLFAVAGNDTTRNSTSHGVHFFAQHPDQWDRLVKDRTHLGTAIDEILRSASPVLHFRRTATSDTELDGQTIAEGDPVVMFFESANRDEDVFENAFDFDIARDPNPHVAFGGGGAHYCLGANLARAQLRVLFDRLAKRVQSFETDEPAYLVSNFIHGIKRMHTTARPRRA